MGAEDLRNTGSTVPLEILSPNSGVRLVKFSPEDAEEIFALIDANRPHLSQYGDQTAAKYPTLELVLNSIVDPPNPKNLWLAIRNQEGVMVGSIDLTPDELTPDRAEIGYYLGSQFTGQGYMTEAVRLLSAYVSDELGYTDLFAKVHEDNLASARVLERAGYFPVQDRGDHLFYFWSKGLEEKYLAKKRERALILEAPEFVMITREYLGEEPLAGAAAFRLGNDPIRTIVINYDHYKRGLGEDFTDCIPYEIEHEAQELWLTRWKREVDSFGPDHYEAIRRALEMAYRDGKLDRYLELKRRQMQTFAAMGDIRAFEELDFYSQYAQELRQRGNNEV